MTDTWQRFNHHDLHMRLIERERPTGPVGDDDECQALFCPYYVPLNGRLGADWGVIVNPASSRFGLLTFEHADCGCPVPDGVLGVMRHKGAPNQDGDMWDVDWRHECEHGWCDDPCEWKAFSA
jgi:hypothetical protein